MLTPTGNTAQASFLEKVARTRATATFSPPPGAPKLLARSSVQGSSWSHYTAFLKHLRRLAPWASLWCHAKVVLASFRCKVSMLYAIMGLSLCCIQATLKTWSARLPQMFQILFKYIKIYQSPYARLSQGWTVDAHHGRSWKASLFLAGRCHSCADHKLEGRRCCPPLRAFNRIE